MFRTKEGRHKSSNIEELDLVSTRRIDVFIRIMITFLASFQLLVPLLVLYRLQQTPNPAEMERMGYYQILTIFISTLCFSASYSIFSTTQRKEVFASTAAYCAVLVVFLGNSNNTVTASNGGLTQSLG